LDNLLDVMPLKSRDRSTGHETLLASGLDHFRRWALLVDHSPTPDVYIGRVTPLPMRRQDSVLRPARFSAHEGEDFLFHS
jgi:hypothetical protein